MEKNTKNIGFSSVSIEITRRCNFACEHCIRGDAQNMDMPTEIIDLFYDKISELQEIVFVGGEPLLNLTGMDYVIKQSMKHNFPLYSLIFTTNGTIFDSDVRFYLDQWAFYVKSCHMTRGTDYRGSVKIYVSCDEWHDKQLAILGMKEKSKDIYERFKEYFSYLDDVYEVAIADDGREPINFGRAKKLPANKTMDVDEKSFLHKLCLAGECEELCATVSCGLAEKIHPEKANTLVNCMVWLLCDGSLVVRGNTPYDYAHKDIICNVSNTHDFFTDIMEFNARVPQDRLCESDNLWVYLGKELSSLLK